MSPVECCFIDDIWRTAMVTSRLEAFSDGVMAVAITLLVFNLKVPGLATANLAHQLGSRWPEFLAYVISFATIGIMWVNHHTLFDKVALVDRTLLFANLGLLLGIATLPFTTALAATWLLSSGGRETAVLVYCISLFAIASTFTLLWWYLSRHEWLLEEQYREVPKAALRRSLVGPVSYAVVTLVGLLVPIVALALCGIIAAYFVVPATKTQRTGAVDASQFPT
jgi:uncharacterized membrane protein